MWAKHTNQPIGRHDRLFAVEQFDDPLPEGAVAFLAEMPRLLDLLNVDQQQLVDLVADAFLADEGKWPFFDYLEGRFDQQRKDAWEILYSFPRVGSWHYSATWWIGMNVPNRPSPEQEVELTIVGMYHSDQLKRYVGLFFGVLERMVAGRRQGPVGRRTARDVSLTSEDFRWDETRAPLVSETLRLIPTLLRREPGTWGGGESINQDGEWVKHIPRAVLDYEGVSTIEQYVERLEALTTYPAMPVAESVPSPLDLVAALDYLDTEWRVSHATPLLTYPSSERAAKLTYLANTPEELDARLSALGEILRSSNAGARGPANRKLRAASRDNPLAPLSDYMLGRAPQDQARITDAIKTLESAISIRDAAQHTEATPRAVLSLTALGLTHPVGDVSRAWQVVTSKVVVALNALREVLAATR
jgi:hypothetical protein